MDRHSIASPRSMAALRVGFTLLLRSTHIPSRQDPYSAPTEPISQRAKTRVFFAANLWGREKRENQGKFRINTHSLQPHNLQHSRLSRPRIRTRAPLKEL